MDLKSEHERALEFWAQVTYHDVLTYAGGGGRHPDAHGDPVATAQAWKVDPEELVRCGVFDDRPCQFPRLRDAVTIARAVGMPVEELRSHFRGQQVIPF